jgi:hypothetical protein
MLETLFNHGTKVEDTDAAARAERRVFLASEAPTTYTFEEVTTYVSHFRKLLALSSQYEYTRNAVHEHEGVMSCVNLEDQRGVGGLSPLCPPPHKYTWRRFAYTWTLDIVFDNA